MAEVKVVPGTVDALDPSAELFEMRFEEDEEGWDSGGDEEKWDEEDEEDWDEEDDEDWDEEEDEDWEEDEEDWDDSEEEEDF